MRYLSTRGGDPASAAEAIVRGISPSGGLYVPESYPKIEWNNGVRGGYLATAHRVMQAYLPDAEPAELKRMIAAAYQSFDHAEVTPVVQLIQAASTCWSSGTGRRWRLKTSRSRCFRI